jgi:hypothetical protein
MSIKLTGQEVIQENLPITNASSERNAWSLQLHAINSSVSDPVEYLEQITPKLNGVPYGVPQWSSKYENPLVLSIENNRVIGTQADWVPAPVVTPTPALIDLLAPGTIVTENGKTYEIRSTPFGNMKFLVKNTTPAVATVAAERAAYVAYIQEQLSSCDNPDVQNALMSLLAWLSKRP